MIAYVSENKTTFCDYPPTQYDFEWEEKMYGAGQSIKERQYDGVHSRAKQSRLQLYIRAMHKKRHLLPMSEISLAGKRATGLLFPR